MIVAIVAKIPGMNCQTRNTVTLINIFPLPVLLHAPLCRRQHQSTTTNPVQIRTLIPQDHYPLTTPQPCATSVVKQGDILLSLAILKSGLPTQNQDTATTMPYLSRGVDSKRVSSFAENESLRHDAGIANLVAGHICPDSTSWNCNLHCKLFCLLWMEGFLL